MVCLVGWLSAKQYKEVLLGFSKLKCHSPILFKFSIDCNVKILILVHGVPVRIKLDKIEFCKKEMIMLTYVQGFIQED